MWESCALGRPVFCCSGRLDLCKMGLLAGESNEAIIQGGLALNPPGIKADIGGGGGGHHIS